jgi:hypothetical protein
MSVLNCNMARSVWALFDEKLTMTRLIKMTLLDDLARVLVMLWAIWWAKRKAIHDSSWMCIG